MIAGQSKQDIELIGIEPTLKMGLSASNENMQHIVKVLTENYSYPIASHIREVCSNHWDSHVENNTPEAPIIVKLHKNEMGSYTLETSDTGLGMDITDFDKYYMNLGESSKRNKPNLLGAKGCGAKAILSYTSQYEVICRKNGKEWKVLVFKGEEFPERTIIWEKETDLPNGVIVIVSGISWYDLGEFKKAIKTELAYFPTCFIQVEGDSFDYNNAKIFKNELFQWRESSPESEMHICFGICHYSINWKSLGIDPIYVPIAINIALDSGVDVMFNRESLIYNKFSKELILSKIKAISEWFVEKYNQSIPEEFDIIKDWGKIGNTNYNVYLAGEIFEINELIEYSSILIKIPNVKGLTFYPDGEYYVNKSSYFFEEYECIIDYSGSEWKKKHIKDNFGVNRMLNGNKHILVNSIPTGKIKEFLCQKYTGKVLFITKSSTRKLGNTSTPWNLRRDRDYLYILQLVNFPKSEWRQRIQEWQFVENQWKEQIIDETNVTNSVEFNDWLAKDKQHRKENRIKGVYSSNHKVLNKAEGDVTINFCVPKLTGRGWKFEKSTRKICELKKNKKLTILFNEEDKEKALALRSIQNKWTIGLIGTREEKRIGNVHNYVKFNDWMMKNRVFKRLMSAIRYDDLVNKFDEIYEREDVSIIKELVEPFYNDVQLLRGYTKKYGQRVESELVESMFAVATEHNLFDDELLDVYNRVKKNIEEYSFISNIQAPERHWTEARKAEVKSLIGQILLYRKKYKGLHEDLEIVLQPKAVQQEELAIAA